MRLERSVIRPRHTFIWFLFSIVIESPVLHWKLGISTGLLLTKK